MIFAGDKQQLERCSWRLSHTLEDPGGVPDTMHNCNKDHRGGSEEGI
jgi:hypothetical protein